MKKFILLLLSLVFLFSFLFGGSTLAFDPQKNTDPDKYYILLDINNQFCTVYEKDENGEYTKIARQFLVTTGSFAPTAKFPYGTPTPTGVWKMGGGRERFGDFASFDGTFARYWTQVVSGIFFHSIMYSKRDVNTLKSSPYQNLGKNLSHGCIRCYVEDAKWLYYNIPEGTTINISATEKRDPETKAKLRNRLSFDEYNTFQKTIYDEDPLPDPAAWVTKNDAPLRTGNGNNDRVVKYLKEGDEVTMLQLGDPWCKALYNGKEGYILTAYLTPEKGKVVANDQAYTMRDHTWMLKSPNKDAEKIVKIPAFYSVKVLEQGEEYSKVQYFDEVGYVRNKSLRQGWGLIRE